MNISRAALGVLSALMIALIAGSPMSAQGRGQGGGRDKARESKVERRAEKMERKEGRKAAKAERKAARAEAIERLELTAEQKAQIKTIRDEFKARHQAHIDEVKALHGQMRDARRTGDKERAEQIRETIKPKMQELHAAREQMKEQIRAILTPEQRAELDQMKSERREKREKKGGRRGEVKAQTDKAERLD